MTLQSIDHWFINAVNDVWEGGEQRPGRNGGTRSIFGYKLHHNMAAGFPIIGVKRTFLRASIGEMIAFCAGASTAAEFQNQGCGFWDANAQADYWLKNENCKDEPAGYLGRIYGVQWRQFRGRDKWDNPRDVDQLQNLLKGLRTDPYGRRHIVSAWNPAELDQMALPPCHVMFQVYCHVDGGLSLRMDQRSADLFLGVPYNITGYAFLLQLLAAMTGREPRQLRIDFGDFHLYEVHESEDGAITALRAAAEEARKSTGGDKHPQATPFLRFSSDINWTEQDFSKESMAVWGDPLHRPFSLENYLHGPVIRARMIE